MGKICVLKHTESPVLLVVVPQFKAVLLVPVPPVPVPVVEPVEVSPVVVVATGSFLRFTQDITPTKRRMPKNKTFFMFIKMKY
jgi:hypothetical protein